MIALKIKNIEHKCLQYVWDPEYLLSPTTGPAKQERAAMEEAFPINYDYFQVCHHCHQKSSSALIVPVRLKYQRSCPASQLQHRVTVFSQHLSK